MSLYREILIFPKIATSTPIFWIFLTQKISLRQMRPPHSIQNFYARGNKHIALTTSSSTLKTQALAYTAPRCCFKIRCCSVMEKQLTFQIILDCWQSLRSSLVMDCLTLCDVAWRGWLREPRYTCCLHLLPSSAPGSGGR